MLIEFSRTGGVSGTIIKISVDTDKLPAEEATKLKTLVNQAKLDQKDNPVDSRDKFTYSINVTEDGKVTKIKYGEGSNKELTKLLMSRNPISSMAAK